MSYSQYTRSEEVNLVERIFTAKTAFHDWALERKLQEIVFRGYARSELDDETVYTDGKSVLVFVNGEEGTKEIHISAPKTKVIQAEDAIQKSILFEITRKMMKTEGGCEYKVTDQKKAIVEKTGDGRGPTIMSAFQLLL